MDRRSVLAACAGGLPLSLLTSALSAAAQTPTDEVPTSAQLRVIGVLTAATFQNAYLLLDIAAISLGKEGLTAERVRNLARALVRQFDGVIGQLRRLEDAHLAADDAAFVDSAMQVCRSLQDDARALGKYADKQTATDQRAFEKAHAQAEQALRNLLGDKPPKTPASE